MIETGQHYINSCFNLNKLGDEPQRVFCSETYIDNEFKELSCEGFWNYTLNPYGKFYMQSNLPDISKFDKYSDETGGAKGSFMLGHGQCSVF